MHIPIGSHVGVLCAFFLSLSSQNSTKLCLDPNLSAQYSNVSRDRSMWSDKDIIFKTQGEWNELCVNWILAKVEEWTTAVDLIRERIGIVGTVFQIPLPTGR